MRYCVVVSEKAQGSWSMLSQWPPVEKHKHTHTHAATLPTGLQGSSGKPPLFLSFLNPLNSLSLLCPSSLNMRLCFSCLWDSLFVLWSDEEAG